MNKSITASNKGTWNFISGKLPGITISRKGRSVHINYAGEEVFLPPYPEIESVKLTRRDGLIIPENISGNWVAQWKANGSNIRIFVINDVLIAVTRGGYLIDWKPYQSLIKSEIKEPLIRAVQGGRYVLFGELVGPKSLVRLCNNEWREYIGGDLGYILFDVYDRSRGISIDLRTVEDLARKSSLLFPPTEWEIDVKKLNMELEKFLEICNGEMWEGFVFKNKERGDPREIRDKTFKWRLDETREFATKIYEKRSRDPYSWKIFEALRKFIIEGYLDPPVTVSEQNERMLEIRNEILELLKRAEDKSAREKLDKEIRRKLNNLLDELLAGDEKKSKTLQKAKSEAIKTFRKIFIWTQ